MGVDYYACVRCGDTFPDCGDYVSCDCGSHWCCDDCAEADGYARADYFDEDEEELYEGEGDSSCKFCREEDFEDYVLLDYALQVLNVSRDHLIKLYKQSK